MQMTTIKIIVLYEASTDVLLALMYISLVALYSYHVALEALRHLKVTYHCLT